MNYKKQDKEFKKAVIRLAIICFVIWVSTIGAGIALGRSFWNQ